MASPRVLAVVGMATGRGGVRAVFRYMHMHARKRRPDINTGVVRRRKGGTCVRACVCNVCVRTHPLHL